MKICGARWKSTAGTLSSNGHLEQRRGQQRKNEFLEAVEEELARRLRRRVSEDPELIARLDQVAGREAEPLLLGLEFLEATSVDRLDR